MKILGKVKFPKEVIEVFEKGGKEYIFANGSVVTNEKYNLINNVLEFTELQKDISPIYDLSYNHSVLLMKDWIENLVRTECYFDKSSFINNFAYYGLKLKDGKKYRLIQYKNRYIFIGHNRNESLPILYTDKNIQESIDNFWKEGHKVYRWSSLSELRSYL